jgi:hypothetical protein
MAHDDDTVLWRYIPSCSLWGETFDVAAAEAALPIALHDPSYPTINCRYGAANIVAPEDVPWSDRLDWVIRETELHLGSLRSFGATDFHIHIAIDYSHQCNLEFTPEQTQRIGALGLHFSIDCLGWGESWMDDFGATKIR